MKDSFIFYKSFFDAINLLGEKAQLKLYKSVMKLNFNQCENETEMLQLCDEIETEMKQNRNTFATFLLIKPQILANFKKYLNGQKGAEKGSLGGAPKGNTNAQKTTPKQPLMNNVLNEECKMNNVLNGVGVEEEEKKIDPFVNPIKTFFSSEYEKIFGARPYLSANDCTRLIELASQNPNIKEIIPDAVKRLKSIEFEGINFTPSASWLLKENNFERVMNGEFNKKEEEPPGKSTAEILEEIRQKRLAEGKGDF